jgi:hypothetical protein
MAELEISRLINIIGHKLEDFPRRSRLLLSDKKWLRIWSCYSTIEDADEAIAAFLIASEPDNSQIGLWILKVYGFLQSLFVQQDAIASLIEELVPDEVTTEFVPKNNNELDHIRQIRNDIAGHPTNRQNKEFSFKLNLRESSSTEIVYRRYSDVENDVDQIVVSILDLQDKQKRNLSAVLLKVIEALDLSEKEYKERFRDMCLTDILTELRYPWIPEMRLAVEQSDRRYQGIMVIDEILRRVGELRDTLQERQITLEGVDEYRIILEHSGEKLKRLFTKKDWNTTDMRDAEVYSFFIKAKYESLIEWAQEIDEYYS